MNIQHNSPDGTYVQVPIHIMDQNNQPIFCIILSWCTLWDWMTITSTNLEYAILIDICTSALKFTLHITQASLDGPPLSSVTTSTSPFCNILHGSYPWPIFVAVHWWPSHHLNSLTRSKQDTASKYCQWNLHATKKLSATAFLTQFHFVVGLIDKLEFPWELAISPPELITVLLFVFSWNIVYGFRTCPKPPWHCLSAPHAACLTSLWPTSMLTHPILLQGLLRFFSGLPFLQSLAAFQNWYCQTMVANLPPSSLQSDLSSSQPHPNTPNTDRLTRVIFHWLHPLPHWQLPSKLIVHYINNS